MAAWLSKKGVEKMAAGCQEIHFLFSTLSLYEACMEPRLRTFVLGASKHWRFLEIFFLKGHVWIFFPLNRLDTTITKKVGHKIFSSSALATLALPPNLQTFFRYFYHALSIYAPKMNPLS